MNDVDSLHTILNVTIDIVQFQSINLLNSNNDYASEQNTFKSHKKTLFTSCQIWRFRIWSVTYRGLTVHSYVDCTDLWGKPLFSTILLGTEGGGGYSP